MNRAIFLLRILSVVWMAVATACYIAWTLHWRLAVDSPVMHYVVFLMHHGFRPYKDIGDSNMPGAYMTEAAAMHLFGGSDLAWRVYEFSLLGTMTAAMIYIARRWDWVAGVFAGGLFIVLHGAEGPQYAAERELVITSLLFAGFALLFAAVRHKRAWLSVFFGLLCGVAASIKPTYLVLPVGILVLCIFALRRRGIRPWAYVLWGVLGLLAAGVLDVLFLAIHGAFFAFITVLRTAVPAYAGMARLPFAKLLEAALPHAIWFLLLLAVPLFFVHWRRISATDWERWALAMGAGFGLLSFLLQGKGFLHHRYEFMAFLLLLVWLEMFSSLQSGGWPRLLAATAICFALILIVPSHLRRIRAIPPSTSFAPALEQDLAQLGGTAELQHRVECLDLVYGCLNALYHLDLVQSTGSTGDLGLFPAQETPLVLAGHQNFLAALKKRPPDVIVVSNEIFSEPNSYGKIDRFPGLATLLSQDYILAIQRSFPHEFYAIYERQPLPSIDCDSYRLYVRKSSAAAVKAATLSKTTLAFPYRP